MPWSPHERRKAGRKAAALPVEEWNFSNQRKYLGQPFVDCYLIYLRLIRRQFLGPKELPRVHHEVCLMAHLRGRKWTGYGYNVVHRSWTTGQGAMYISLTYFEPSHLNPTRRRFTNLSLLSGQSPNDTIWMKSSKIQVKLQHANIQSRWSHHEAQRRALSEIQGNDRPERLVWTANSHTKRGRLKVQHAEMRSGEMKYNNTFTYARDLGCDPCNG